MGLSFLAKLKAAIPGINMLPTSLTELWDLAVKLFEVIYPEHRRRYLRRRKQLLQQAKQAGIHLNPVKGPVYQVGHVFKMLLNATGWVGKDAFKKLPSGLTPTVAATHRVAAHPYYQDARQRRQVVANIEANSVRHAGQGEANAVRDTVAAGSPDGEIAYARVTRGIYTCGFCVFMASRGPVYRSKQQAGLTPDGANRFHNRCDCEVVMVIKGQPWAGEQQYLEYRELYDLVGDKDAFVSVWTDAVRARLFDQPSDGERENPVDPRSVITGLYGSGGSGDADSWVPVAAKTGRDYATNTGELLQVPDLAQAGLRVDPVLDAYSGKLANALYCAGKVIPAPPVEAFIAHSLRDWLHSQQEINPQGKRHQFSVPFRFQLKDTHFPERWEENNDQVGADYIRQAFVSLNKGDMKVEVDPDNPDRYRVEAFKTVDGVLLRFVWFVYDGYVTDQAVYPVHGVGVRRTRRRSLTVEEWNPTNEEWEVVDDSH